MGGTTWTDARDSRLFILVLDRANINGEGFAALAAAYKKEYRIFSSQISSSQNSSIQSY